MSSKLPQNPEWQIQEERLQHGTEKKKQRDTASLIWGDNEANLALLKMRKE